ncbi:MAG TPA: hypothetical protein VFZ01_16375, partial [Geminicoccaceae bacterium]
DLTLQVDLGIAVDKVNVVEPGLPATHLGAVFGELRQHDDAAVAFGERAPASASRVARSS